MFAFQLKNSSRVVIAHVRNKNYLQTKEGKMFRVSLHNSRLPDTTQLFFFVPVASNNHLNKASPLLFLQPRNMRQTEGMMAIKTFRSDDGFFIFGSSTKCKKKDRARFILRWTFCIHFAFPSRWCKLTRSKVHSESQESKTHKWIFEKDLSTVIAVIAVFWESKGGTEVGLEGPQRISLSLCLAAG